MIAHAIAPVFVPAGLRAAAAGVDAERRAACEEPLAQLAGGQGGLLGPRMGSVTYRVLCQAPGLVLALPPTTEARALLGRRS